MSKCLSDGRMSQLWRKVVLINAHNRCYICKKWFPDEGLEAHHIIKRVRKITRWLPENGTALCHECHRELHNKNKIKRDLENSWQYMDLLDELNMYTYKDYLVNQGLTHFEYYDKLAKEMKEIINNN